MLEEQGLCELRTHLQECCVECVRCAELTLTVQAVRVLVEEQQTQVIASSGLPFWLVNLFSDLAQSDRTEAQNERVEAEVSLSDVMQLLIQVTSLLLVSQAKGIICHSNKLGWLSLGHTQIQK